MRGLIELLKLEVKEAYSPPSLVIYYWLSFSFQFLVYGELLSFLVRFENYAYYYGTGIVLIMTFNQASWLGRHFIEGAKEGRLRYYLSLPINRSTILIEALIFGVIDNFVKALIPLTSLLYIFKSLTLTILLTSMISLMLVTLGIIGLMVSLSVIAFKSFDIYSGIVAGLSAILIRFSTIYYPINFIPPTYYGVVILNPITYGADLLRGILGFPSLSWETSVIVLLSLITFSSFMGITFIMKYVEGVKTS